MKITKLRFYNFCRRKENIAKFSPLLVNAVVCYSNIFLGAYKLYVRYGTSFEFVIYLNDVELFAYFIKNIYGYLLTHQAENIYVVMLNDVKFSFKLTIEQLLCETNTLYHRWDIDRYHSLIFR